MAPPIIAYFITPHGFGHASRAAAVMGAVLELIPNARFELFTTCPPWIFEDTLQIPFGYHAVHTDIGMVQLSPLEEDAAETCRRLDRWLPFEDPLMDDLAGQLGSLKCSLVVCDVSVLGIAAARRAGLPSVLVENFTWDWIYNGYASVASGLSRHADYLKSLISQVTHHIQTQPLCRPAKAAVVVGPIARPPRTGRIETRHKLGIGNHRKMVLVSMGGVPDRFDFLETLPADLDVCLVIPGSQGSRCRHKHVISLTTRSAFYHPDLMAAADVLVGKAGYSTLAEAYFAGIPFGFVNRSNFPESSVLERFLSRYMSSRPINSRSYADGLWINTLPELLAMPRTQPVLENGAGAVASMIQGLLA